MNKRFVARIAAIGLAVSALGAAGSVAASAAPADCSSGRVCIYDGVNYGTQLGWRNGGFALENVSVGNADRMSSWSNNSVKNACWYININGGGTGLQMNQYTNNPDVGWFWQDSMSSWKGSNC